MKFEGKPPEIKKSIRSDNVEHLKAAGKKGGRKTQAMRRREKEIAEVLQQQAEQDKLLEEYERMVKANEHILTPDGEDPTEH